MIDVFVKRAGLLLVLAGCGPSLGSMAPLTFTLSLQASSVSVELPRPDDTCTPLPAVARLDGKEVKSLGNEELAQPDCSSGLCVTRHSAPQCETARWSLPASPAFAEFTLADSTLSALMRFNAFQPLVISDKGGVFSVCADNPGVVVPRDSEVPVIFPEDRCDAGVSAAFVYDTGETELAPLSTGADGGLVWRARGDGVLTLSGQGVCVVECSNATCHVAPGSVSCSLYFGTR